LGSPRSAIGPLKGRVIVGGAREEPVERENVHLEQIGHFDPLYREIRSLDVAESGDQIWPKPVRCGKSGALEWNKQRPGDAK
jgi:hypothetical protein